MAAETGIPVTVICVPGNHARRSAKIDHEDPHDNFDYPVATQVATRLQNEITAGAVSVFIPRSWTAFADVRGYIWALNHGHAVRGFAGFPWYGFDRKAQRIQALAARTDARISYFGYGHYHTDTKTTSAGAKSYHNGAFYLTDPHSTEALSLGNTPQQNLYAVDDDYGVILEIPIYVRDLTRETRLEERKLIPAFGRQLVTEETEPSIEGFQLISA